MRYILLCLALLGVLPTQAQSVFVKQDYQAIDAHALTIPANLPLHELARQLTATTTDDELKVRAIYRWITAHIRYDEVAFHHTDTLYKTLWKHSFDPDTNVMKQKYLMGKALYALHSGKGVCDGYASLFKALCDEASVPCEVVGGYAKMGAQVIGQPFPVNHSWNAVKLKGEWHLVDATWGAGYSDAPVTKFFPSFEESYFLSDPAVFIYNHFPVQEAWQLLPHPVSLSGWWGWPMTLLQFVPASINRMEPANGLIQASLGDTVWITVHSTRSDLQPSAKDDLFLKDPKSTLNLSALQYSRVPDADGTVYRFYYLLTNPSVRQIYLLNGLQFIGYYNLKIRPHGQIDLKIIPH